MSWGEAALWLFQQVQCVCVCMWKGKHRCARTEVPHLHMQLFQDLPQYTLSMGVTNILVSFVKAFPPSSPTPIPLLSLCLVFFHTLFPKRLAGLTMHCDFFSTGLYEGSWRQFSLVSLTSFITYQRNKQTESNSFDHGKSRKSIKNPMKIH